MLKSLIVAMDQKGLIGAGNDLPWKLSADLKRFKQLTMGHPIIMGRKTFESIPRPLPGRVSVVISRQSLELPQGEKFMCFCADGIHSALEVAKMQIDAGSPFAGQQPAETFVIGGSEIYKLALPLIDKLYVTHVENVFRGDTYFPDLNWLDWNLTAEEQHQEEDFPFPYRFCEYVRV
jgi:dihydrofolate reductase